MTRILILGAGGQLGRELQRRPVADDVHRTALDRAACDITDAAAVEAAVRDARPDVVINAAAYTDVDGAEDDLEAAFAVNRDGPAALATACAATDARLVHISTDYVFDGTKAGSYTEDDPVTPINAYGRSKEAGERAVRDGLAGHAILRTAWVYAGHGRNFLNTMLRVGPERDRLQVVADQHGTPTAAPDLADAALAVAHNLAGTPDQSAVFGTFHATNAGSTTWHGFAEAIFAEVARTRGTPAPEIAAITSANWPTRAARPANSCLACDRLARVHGVSIPKWEDGLRQVLAESGAGTTRPAGAAT